MKQLLFLLFAFSFVLPASVRASEGQASLSIEQQARHQRIVMFRPGLSWESMEKAVRQAGGKPRRRIALINAVVAYFPTEVSRELLTSIDVRQVAEDGVAYMFQDKAADQPSQSVPWGIEKSRAASKWEAVKGKQALVCVIDSGAQTDHPDLAGVIAGGENLLDPTKSYEDEIDHGTHVSGTIAAVDNSIGVVGVNPYSAKLYHAKVFGNEGSTTWSTVAAAVDSCVKAKARIITMSLGGRSNNPGLAEAIKKAYEAGVVLIAAAGNENGAVSYPAAYPEVIAVAASDSNNKRAYFSNKGPEVDLIAPGVGVNSTVTGSSYSFFSGTSMAAPHVAGAMSLILSLQPHLNPDGALKVLNTCVSDIGLAVEEQGKGLLDLGKEGCALPTLRFAMRRSARPSMSSMPISKTSLSEVFGN